VTRASVSRVVLPFAAVTLIWGTTWYVIKTQLGVVPPQWSVTYRFAVASLLMFGACFVMRRTLRFPLAAHGFFLLLGLLQFAGNFNFVYQASRSITSGLIAVVFALLVVPNTLFGRLFLKQPISGRFMIGAGLGIVGVALLFERELTGAGWSGAFINGLALTGCAVVLASISNVMQGMERARRYDMFGMLAFAMAYGALIDAVYAWATSGPPVVEWTPAYVGGVFYLAAFASALAFLLYFNVIRIIGPAWAAYSSVLIPFIAMTISTLLEGYQWTPVAAVGALLAIIGLVIALRTRSVPAGTAAAGGTTGRS
jgi:drug/metabolite transporter (DMT)-like permease